MIDFLTIQSVDKLQRMGNICAQSFYQRGRKIAELQKRIYLLEGANQQQAEFAFQAEMSSIDAQNRGLEHLLKKEMNSDNDSTESVHPEAQENKDDKRKDDADVLSGKAEDPQKPNPSRRKEKQRGHGPTLQNLEKIDRYYNLEDPICCACCRQMKQIGEDVTELIGTIPRRHVLYVNHVAKYACNCVQKTCVSAEVPERIVDGGRYDDRLVIEVVTSKYVHQIPLQRVVNQFRAEGLIVSSQTLWDYCHAAAKKLLPIWKRIKKEIQKSNVIGIDQSPWNVLLAATSWQAWQMTNNQLSYFQICPTKGSEDGLKFLGDFRGIVIGDAATTHDSLAKTKNIVLAYCWAHAFRKAKEMKDGDAVTVREFKELVRSLYDIERLCPKEDIELRKELRQTESAKVIDRIKIWLDITEPLVLKSSPVGKLIQYVQNQWDGLREFLKNPEIPLDNNQTERGYIWLSIGRRSYFGTRGQKGAVAFAIFHSIVESCRRNNVDPGKYIEAALKASLNDEQMPLPNDERCAANWPLHKK